MNVLAKIEVQRCVCVWGTIKGQTAADCACGQQTIAGSVDLGCAGPE